MTKKSNYFLKPTNLNNIAAIPLWFGMCISFVFSIQQAQAVELGAQLLKGSDSGSTGYGFTVSDKFSHRGAFSWTLGYSKLNDAAVDWNNSELFFPIETADVYLSYRFTPHSFNPEATGLSYDIFAGTSVVLTENKSDFNSLGYEKYFSESGDINFLVGGVVRYSFDRNTSIQIGVKHYPSFSEFDSISVAYLGFNYRFGRNLFL